MPGKTSARSDGVSNEAGSALTDAKVNELPDWRAAMISEIRRLLNEAVPEVVEEVKWRRPANSTQGIPVWSHHGIICTGETYKDKVKVSFFKGASLEDPADLFNARLRSRSRRAIDLYEVDQIDQRAFKSLVRDAAAFNAPSTRS